MKYYVVSDIHGFFSEMKEALQAKGFFDDTEPHKLIVCGDMMDRGNEADEMQKFMLDLLHKNELIFIRGNHEDLFLDMINNFEKYRWDISIGYSHHNSNGTWYTALQLSGMDEEYALQHTEEFFYKLRESAFYKELLPASVNYYETNNYIFVHGWIPCATEDMPPWYRKYRSYKFNPDWRNATVNDWNSARWFNGMELAKLWNIVEKDKQIVCGHFHTSWGHSFLDKKCPEWEDGADFSPYQSNGIIAIDACTAHTGQVNCLVIED